ncbi:MAG: Transketolase-like protein [candidate division TA06 bacterium 34_109]|uniref:Transketolase-like protein n=1 Tax=candidate division TA06 bacterium 34_109 TaxID=1635277 RepID=A0A124G049_UNCT6|nr:MAG: Transketolase-like protein [candidate division TA06 bacterium 34_109]
MPIIDSKTGKIKKDYSIEQLIEKAKEMRAYNMVALTAAGSGHTGGTLSIMDIAAALYLKHIKHDPANPEWEERDRVIWSVGHKAPAIYVALGMAGYFPVSEVVKLRKLWSGFEGHPNRFKTPGIELSSGSLGQGLGVAVGCALNARLEKKNYYTYCILGDGELDEGSVWEAIMSAAHYKLDNLIAIVDRNQLQIDGPTEEVMRLEKLVEKWQSFGWQVLEMDGHKMKEILNTLDKALQIKGQPIVIIAHTIKGKEVSFAENVVGYHGICPKDGLTGAESLEKALQDIKAPGFNQEKVNKLLKIACDYQEEVNQKVEQAMPKFSKEYWWNSQDIMKVKMIPTRNGFGDAIEELGEANNVVAFGADITSSIKMDQFYAHHPERKKRFFELGIAEQNMTLVAAGFAKEGKIAFIGSYGVFVTGRNWDQIRTTLCYNNFDVKIANAHGGLSVGPDGATHQALEEISNMYYLPNMHIIVPCDSLETKEGTKVVAKIPGPAVIRYAREATPVVTKEDSPYQFGCANIIRFREEKENFVDAFETKLSTDYQTEDEDIAIIACGPMVAEAMRAAYILKKEYNLETRVINIHTVKPIDREVIRRAAQEIGIILTAEEHQKGGFGNIVAGVVATSKSYNTPFLFDMIGVNDEFGLSGAPWELLKVFGLTAEHIAKRAKELFDQKKL